MSFKISALAWIFSAADAITFFIKLSSSISSLYLRCLTQYNTLIFGIALLNPFAMAYSMSAPIVLRLISSGSMSRS